MRALPYFLCPVLLCLGLGTMPLRAQVTFDWAEVGDAGNAADPLNSGSIPGIGSVSSTYRIATTEVSLSQYVAFLNAVAQTDLYGLYNTNMSSNLNVAGINRSGSSGSYTYSVIGSGNRPVTYVSWSDAARFTNWMHNGQGSGGTESGVYDLSLSSPSRSASALYWIPSENEWYKAAYYDPGAGGPADDYWLYPTRSDTAPDNTIGPAPNNANIRDGSVNYAVTNSSTYDANQDYLTDVGAFSGAASYYGTFDQGGNVFEWTDSLVLTDKRVLRGGSWNLFESNMRSSFQLSNPETYEAMAVGFRLASTPEPSTYALLVVGGAALFALRRRRA